ncbi:MAG: hypothetical protein JST54_23925 [Deltaproteobacteria bacterium]|nr:hypothetical protein [Deltaproteobacteria bacterium]
MAEVTPLRPDPDEPELEAVREAIRASRRRSAWWLMGAGLVLVGGGLAALLGGGSARGAADEAGSWVASIVVTTGCGAALVGLGLVGTAVFVLVKSRRDDP